MECSGYFIMNQQSHKACLTRPTSRQSTATSNTRQAPAATTYTQYSLTRQHHILSADRLDVRERGANTPLLSAEIHGTWLRVQQASGTKKTVAHVDFPKHLKPTICMLEDSATIGLDEAFVRVDLPTWQTRDASPAETYHYSGRVAVLPDGSRVRWEPMSSSVSSQASTLSSAGRRQHQKHAAATTTAIRCVEVGPNGQTLHRLAYMPHSEHPDCYEISLLDSLNVQSGLGAYVLFGFIGLRERARKYKSRSDAALNEKEMGANVNVLELLDSVQDDIIYNCKGASSIHKEQGTTVAV
jgi:hypothetical protein